MRRGLISWSQEELPRSALDARVDRVRVEMQKRNLGAVIAYASFALPSPLQWLCNFIPYWSEAIIVVLPEGPPTLLVANTPRTHGWIREVSHMGDLLAAPNVGASTAQILDKHVPAGVKIGVIGFNALPWSAAEPLFKAGWESRLVDASDVYLAARHPGDSYEIGLATQAQSKAERAIASIPASATNTSQVSAAVDGSARMAGAEESLVRIARDLNADATLLRIEGEFPLGDRYAVESSMAYRGVWVRVAHCIAKGTAPKTWAAADAWFDGALERIGEQGLATDIAKNAPGKSVHWTLEASTSMAPLSIIASSEEAAMQSLPRGSIAVFSVQMETEDGPWLRATALRVGHGALKPESRHRTNASEAAAAA